MLLKIIEVVCVSVLPISLLRFNIIAKHFRLVVLALVIPVVLFLMFMQNISFYEIGLRADNILSFIPVYFLAAIIAVIFLFFLSKLVKNRMAEEWHKDPHFLFLFIPISFAQQFLFQGFILFQLKSVFSTSAAVIITALIFGYLHTIYPKPLFSFVLGTIAGLFFATLYVFCPNIIVSSLLHSILMILKFF